MLLKGDREEKILIDLNERHCRMMKILLIFFYITFKSRVVRRFAGSADDVILFAESEGSIQG